MSFAPFHTRLNDGDLYLRLLDRNDAPALLAIYRTNRDFLQPWEPTRENDFYNLETMRRLLQHNYEAAFQDEVYSYGIFLTQGDELIGRVTLSNLARGVWQNANLGYFLAEKCNGRGYTTRAVRLIVSFAFNDLGLHRVTAATLVHNYGSMRVLEKAGFRREGLALRFLKIDGRWQDHYLFAITSEEI